VSSARSQVRPRAGGWKPAIDRAVRRRPRLDAAAGLGDGRGAVADHLECWREDDVTGCDLSTHVGGARRRPAGRRPRLTAMNRLLAATDTALARDGWRCDRTLAGRRPAEPAVWQATCRPASRA
jgi:hypothetical protein